MVFVYIKKGKRKREWEPLSRWDNEPASEQTGRQDPSTEDTQVRDLGGAEWVGMKEQPLVPDVQRAGEPFPRDDADRVGVGKKTQFRGAGTGPYC